MSVRGRVREFDFRFGDYERKERMDSQGQSADVTTTFNAWVAQQGVSSTGSQGKSQVNSVDSLLDPHFVSFTMMTLEAVHRSSISRSSGDGSPSTTANTNLRYIVDAIIHHSKPLSPQIVHAGSVFLEYGDVSALRSNRYPHFRHIVTY